MIGTTLTHYRITAKLGEGGMGEVYRARDTKLGRDVAIKVLAASFSRDAQSLGRFEREAKALAALNHPHIAGIYGFDADQGTHFLVLELVEGKTLAERLRRGPLPLKEALKVARQMAEAIQEAHEKGIIHRDLKPGNVKITPNGRVKVLDFGLAKMEQAFRGEPESSCDPEAATIQAVTTRPGAVMGTPAYMSPEQARGQELDKRTDIWAFGCCLFECLSGRKPFQGQTASDLMAAVLKSDPDWAQIPSETPREVVSLLRRCLEKDASRRLSSIGDIAITLEETTRMPAIPSRPGPEPGAYTKWLRPVAVGLLIFAIGAGVFFWMRKGPNDQRPDGSSIPNTIGASSGSSPQPNFARIESLAVLPFENSSRDANKDYFAEALTEELSGKLGQIRSLKTVKSRGTVLGYKGAKKSISEIARDLGVDAVVAGSAGLEDSRVTVSVRLIEAGSNRQRWSQTYQRDLAEVDHLESEMALAIAKEIQTDLLPGEQEKLTKGRGVNPEALAEYQRGQFYHRKSTDAYNLKAIEKLTNAVHLDKEFAAAWAALAMAYVDRVYQFAPREHEAWEEKAALAVRRALEINPDEADAYAARGLMNWTPWSRFRHEEAVEDLQHAVSLNPNSFVAHDWLDNIYSHTGLLEEALAENRINRSLDPSASDTYLNGASDWLWHGEYEKALEIWPKASLDSWPLFGGSHYAWTLFALGKTNEAAAKLDEFEQLDRTKHPGAEDDTGELAGMRALLLAAAGDVAGAETQIKSAAGKQSGYGEFHHTAYFIAAAYARLNNRTEAVKWLKTTVDTGFPCYVLFRDDPNLDNLRRPPLPAFQTFLSEQEKVWRKRRNAWTKVDAASGRTPQR